ncbi:MAG TPA: ABC transporter substrate-binding protein [Acidimicrobiales bacterium]|jgi:putative spermidine/putrescine transport system substrate-binding protein|nr:ABC transporter substrate-binding protein [Acidimicrobiales bacterium]
MALKAMKAALLAGAMVSSAVAGGVASIPLAGGATKVNWARVSRITTKGATTMAALVKAAQAEKTLNVVALPNNWANYGTIMSDFTVKYGIKVNSVNPAGTSAQEIAAIKRGKGRGDGPDVIDVSTKYAITAKKRGLLTRFRVTTWKEIPAQLKDPKGYWFDDYGGYVAIGCDTTVLSVCPTSFKSLLAATATSGYKIGINNSPLTSNGALAAVQAASVANGGTLNDVAPGVTYFAALKKNGTFVNTIADATTAQNGTTNVIIWWDDLQVSGITQNGWKVVIPSDAVVGEFNSQAISRFAPHPAAARLWEEYLYSMAGQNLFLKGGVRPSELAFMQAHGTADKASLATLPKLPATSKPLFPTTAQIARASTIIDRTWSSKVG